ncbi:glycosyltransferase family 2 protein [Geomonas nitrogeniifigens]|uniref:Glycosyltransferase family 2 protein n=1 Tax=Geomonas diazotrophica TaxID=2843197 RepID=A0ABX8JEN8_9BACT|nr:glycosyltransferase family 2 protein [Geomonas nitrogeniifigens]QWV95942.1 glycosyltransferase family 2 protein [Geomonas nitrogeniifigens]
MIIPAYNEAERIGETIRALAQIRSKLQDLGLCLCIYVIDDGSTDQTRSICQSCGADRVLYHHVNHGVGAAVRTGFAAARADGADIVVKFDADLQHDPEDILNLIQPILSDEADLVYGNRFDQIEYRMPLLRLAGNVFFTRLMKWLTKWPLKDSQPGILAASKAYVDVFRIPGDYNYTQQILIDAYHKGMRFAHCPVKFRKRVTGKSFITLKYPFKVILQILVIIAGLKPMRIFAPVGLASFLLGSSIFCYEVFLWMINESHRPVAHVNAVLGLLLFGIQTLFFGIIAELTIQSQKK